MHRPYTQRGDIYLNLRDDQFEIVNPGLLPLGVTPQNILHQSVRRNNELARVFHDLGLMEREGSGYDLFYEVLLSQGRQLPKLREGMDSVTVIIEKRIVKPEIIDFLTKADQTYSLKQREKIVLGLLAQHESLVLEDIGRYPGSSIGEIHARIGKEISRRQVKLSLNRLCNKDELRIEGENRGRIYWLL